MVILNIPFLTTMRTNIILSLHKVPFAAVLVFCACFAISDKCYILSANANVTFFYNLKALFFKKRLNFNPVLWPQGTQNITM